MTDIVYPKFNLKPIDTIPDDGKFLVVNVLPDMRDVSIGTAKLFPEMQAMNKKQTLKWAVAWDYFPLLQVEIETDGGDDGNRKAATA